MLDEINKIVDNSWEMFCAIGYCHCPSKDEHLLGTKYDMEHYYGKFKEGISVRIEKL